LVDKQGAYQVSMQIVHQQDVLYETVDSDAEYGSGIALKRLEDPDGSNVRYFVKWPESTNGIIAGWYTTKEIIVLGTTYFAEDD